MSDQFWFQKWKSLDGTKCSMCFYHDLPGKLRIRCPALVKSSSRQLNWKSGAPEELIQTLNIRL